MTRGLNSLGGLVLVPAPQCSFFFSHLQYMKRVLQANIVQLMIQIAGLSLARTDSF